MRHLTEVPDVQTGNLINGVWEIGSDTFAVADKFTGQRLADVSVANEHVVRRAVDAGLAAAVDPLNPSERSSLLVRVADLVEANRQELQSVIVAETGFPIADAGGEVERACETLRRCALETTAMAGEMIPFTGSARGQGRLGYTVSHPIGVVAAITPFNSPLNTVCHKVVAAGNAVVLKPSDRTPLTATFLGQLFVEAQTPPGLVSIVHGGADAARALLADQRVGFYAFTGSTAIGEEIQRAAGLRRTQLELGSIAATVVLDDANIERAVPRCVSASFRKAGQVCTSIQLLMVQRGVFQSFRDRYLASVEALVAGDPRDPSVDVGPLISESSAKRVASMIADRSVTVGGARSGSVVQPAVVEDVDPSSRFYRDEIFGPVTCLIPVDSVDHAISLINTTPYGLASGVFTSSTHTAMRAAERLRVGGVHINETSSSRVDLMPYGGVKASGHGLEGPRYAIREMSEQRLVTFSVAD